MEQGFIDILKQLVKEQGNAALTDARKCKALLADYTKNEYKKESAWLVQAVEAGIAKAIDGADDLAACKKAKIRDLEEEKGLSSTVAADIVNALAFVLRGDTMKEIRTAAGNSKFDEAKRLYKDKQYDKAFPLLVELASENHEIAQLYLGQCYGRGLGVTKDKAKAAELYRKAADQGNAEAQYAIGDCLAEGRGVAQDYGKAVEYLLKSADQGCPRAMISLSRHYILGNGVPKDVAKSREWEKKGKDLIDKWEDF
jgi:TPR repeat protein